MSSAQVIRDCKPFFNKSRIFKPLIDQGREQRRHEGEQQFRRRSKAKKELLYKIGHGGTLDPMATGVLILGIGKGTKSLNNFLNCTKTYETVVVFGASSDSYDRCGRTLRMRGYDHITKEKVEEALASFRGTYQQMPPIFSALKMNGKPLYEYAREGLPIPREIETREVTVTDMEIVEFYEPGTHKHYWPSEEATDAEKLYAEQLWRTEKQQLEGKKMSPEDQEADSKALENHQAFKRKLDERQDDLVVESQSKKRKTKRESDTSPALMSGALGELPPKGKGSDLAAPVDENAPPPWDGKGPPAVRIRMTATKGFYVRSLCHDLGAKLDSAGLMAALTRHRQGDFSLGGPNCLEFEDLAKGEDVWGPKVANALRRWNGEVVAEENEEKADQDVKMKVEPVSVESKTEDAVGESAELKTEDVARESVENKAQDTEAENVEAATVGTKDATLNGFIDSSTPVKTEVA